MKVQIDIDTKTFVRFWLVVIGFVLLGFAIYSASRALTIIGIAVFLALALNPPVNMLAKLLPGKSRIGATALAYVAVLLFLSVVIFLVIPPVIEQTSKFAQTVPGLVESATAQYQGVNELITRYNLQNTVDNVTQSIRNSATDFAAGVGSNLLASIGSALSSIAAAFIIMVLTFLMLIEGPKWMSRIWGVYHDQKRMEHHKSVVNKIYKVVTSYVSGQLSIAAIAGILSGLVVFILSLIFPVPANLIVPSATFVFVLSLIPMFGATLAGILVSLILALNDLTAAIIFVVYFIVYQQVENNVISPKVQSHKLGLSPLAVLVALTVGLYLFGIAGGIISIPIAGSIQVLVDEYLRHAKNKREQNKKLPAKVTITK